MRIFHLPKWCFDLNFQTSSSYFLLNPTLRGGLLKPPSEQKSCFWHLLWSKLPGKIWLFPNIYDNTSHTLSGSQNGLKRGFYSIFVLGGPKIQIQNCVFLAFLWLKWTQLVSKTNDYQQFLANFEWFLAVFQISDVKHELSPVELRVCKNGIFWAKNLFQKFFLGYFCPPIKVMSKNRAKRASKWV